jgi:hypothetical protein
LIVHIPVSAKKISYKILNQTVEKARRNKLVQHCAERKQALPKENSSATSQKNEFVTASPNPCSTTPSLLN